MARNARLGRSKKIRALSVTSSDLRPGSDLQHRLQTEAQPASAPKFRQFIGGDLPVGLFLELSSLISDFPKNISVPTYPKSDLELFVSRPTEGRIRIVRDAGWDAVDAAAFCARRDRRAGR